MSEFVFTSDTLKKLAKLRGGKLRAATAWLGKTEFDHCSRDPLYWMDATAHAIPYVYTLDNHPMFKCLECEAESSLTYRFGNLEMHLKLAHEIVRHSASEVHRHFSELPTTRPFPLYDYMKPIVNAWLAEPFMVIEKSRDMMMTWLCVVMYSWDTLFHRGRQNIFQSEDAGKTLELVRRAKFIYDKQPAFLRGVAPAQFSVGPARAGALAVPGLDSEILGFAQGPDQIRQYHPSGVLTDETAFQVYAAEGFAAIKPAVQAGGRYTGVSTANPGWFYALARDITDDLVL